MSLLPLIALAGRLVALVWGAGRFVAGASGPDHPHRGRALVAAFVAYTTWLVATAG